MERATSAPSSRPSDRSAQPHSTSSQDLVDGLLDIGRGVVDDDPAHGAEGLLVEVPVDGTDGLNQDARVEVLAGSGSTAGEGDLDVGLQKQRVNAVLRQRIDQERLSLVGSDHVIDYHGEARRGVAPCDVCRGLSCQNELPAGFLRPHWNRVSDAGDDPLTEIINRNVDAEGEAPQERGGHRGLTAPRNT